MDVRITFPADGQKEPPNGDSTRNDDVLRHRRITSVSGFGMIKITNRGLLHPGFDGLPPALMFI